jgi:DNA-binding NarL/FixJ family response regulator
LDLCAAFLEVIYIYEPGGFKVKKTTVLLADDHAIVVEGLEALLKDSFDLVGLVNDGRALVKDATRLKPDVVVTDISMPLLNGLDAIQQLRTRQCRSKIIVLTMHREAQMAVHAFRAGASGYLLKDCAGEELSTAIHEVMRDRVYVTPLIAKELIKLVIEPRALPENSSASLTQRQREVLQLVAEGRTMKEIAHILQISSRTAESHKYEAMEVLGVHTTAELIQYAVRQNLVG